MTKILVGSVFGPSVYNDKWYALQKEYLKKTTSEVDHKIICNNVDVDSATTDEILIRNTKNIGHPAALHQLIDYMRGVKNDYQYFLILDSDCFPVQNGWDSILSSQMRRFKKSIAAPIRYENLDRFPHPCAVFMDLDGLSNPGLDFSYTKFENLLCDEINEVGGAMYEIINAVLPLLRTNRVNLHPVAAGVYHNLFYHHGAGSRGFQYRVIHEYNYYEHWMDKLSEKKYGQQITDVFFDNPKRFIDKLINGY